ncbi:MAG: ABC transporter ATP-binding protein [Pirellulales bacterium]
MAHLDFDAVTKTFPGPLTALDRFALSVADRELVVLVGPSGAGKTTALRIAAGLERATSGSIRMDGRPIDHLRPKDRDLAMVFQQPALYPHLTVRGNAAFSLSMRRTPRDEIDRRVAKIAAALGIAELLDRYPETLSGGQAQRAALARALVRRPNCLLLDEPFASLDAPLRAELRREFRASHGRDPLTTLFVTHDQDEALALADRLVVLRAGRIEQVGTTQQVYELPANRFVASFLGSPPMNFLAGKLMLQEGRLWFERPDIRLKVAPPMHASLLQYAGRELVLGIRPDAVTITEPGAANDDAILEGTLIEQEFQGDRWLVRLRTKSGDMISSLLRAGRSSIGDTVQICLDTHQLHFFAAQEQGRRL